MPKPPTKQKPKKVTRKAKSTKAAKAKPAAKKAAKPTKAAKPKKATKAAKAAKPKKATKPAKVTKPAAKPAKVAKPTTPTNATKAAKPTSSAAVGAYRALLDDRFAKLSERNARFAGGGFEINEPLTGESLEILSVVGAREPGGVLRELYDQLDGVTAHWTLPDGELSGGLSIPRATNAYLRPGVDFDSRPLEGVLWTDDDEPEVREQLQRMYILDSVPGRSDFLTFIPDEDRVYYVQRGEIQVLQTTLAETIELLLRYLGSSSLRSHLVHPDWRERIAADPTLTWLDAS